MKSQRTLIIIAGFALALLGAVTWAEWQDATSAPVLADQVAHIRDVQTNLSELLSRVQDIEAGSRGFVLTGEPAFLEPFLASLNTADSQLRVVRTLTSDNPNQQARCDVLEPLIARMVAVAQTTVDLRRGSGFEAARQMVAGGRGKAVMDQIHAEIALMNAEEQTLLGRRRAAARDQRRSARALVAIGSSLSFLLLVAAFAFVLRENRLRHQAEQRLHEFNDQLEQRVREQAAELVQTSRTLWEAENRFRIMVEGVTDYAILMLDPGGRVISWNSGATRLKGYREEEIVGQHFSRFYPEEDVARDKPAMELEQAAASGRSQDEGWRVRKDGTRFWAHVVITALHDKGGRLCGFVKVTRDMTEHEQAQEESQVILRTAMDGFWVVDMQGRFLEANEAYCQIVGYTRDELLAMRITDIEAAESPEVTAAHIAALMRTGSDRFLTRHRRKDGAVLDVEVSANYLPLNGGRIFVFVRDITERIQTHAELSKLSMAVDASHEVIFMTDLDGVIRFVNPAFTRLYGYAAAEVVGKATPRILKSGTMPREAYESFWNSILSKQVVTGEIINKARDGRLLTVQSSANPILNEQGESIGFLAIQHDVTERKLAEDALRKSAQLLTQSQRIARLGNWTVDLETGKVTWSDELCRIYGVSPEVFVPTVDAFFALVHPDDQSAARSWTDSVLSEKKPGPLEFRVVRPDGTIRVIEGDADVQVNAENKPIVLVGTAQDITERKRAEDELRRSYDLLDQTGKMAAIGGWELDPDTQTLRWTKETYRIHEADPAFQPSVAEAIQFYAPEARPVITAAVQAAIDAGTPFDLELPLVTAQGRRIWVHAQGIAERRDGKTIRLYGAFQDITERKQAEATLYESEARYRGLFEANPHPMWVYDVETLAFLKVNDAAVAHYGYWHDEFLAMTLADIRPTEDVPRLLADIAHVDDDATSEGIWRHRKKDGSIIDVEITAHAIDYGGRRARLVLAHDITKRKRAEESQRLQGAALHAAADAIVITDRAGVIEWVNPAFTQLTGYTAEEALGRNAWDLVKSGKHAPAFYKDFWETILAGRPWHGEMINRRKDGSLYTEDQAVTPILDASGAVTHFVAIKEDMTEHLQLEAQFRQAQKMESVGQLASGIAHDFNNLLTVINGMSELVLTRVSPDDPVHADVQEIQRAGERAATLTRQLLAFSRQQILESRVLKVNTVVAGMEELLRRVLGEDIDLVVVPTPGLGNVKADPGQLEQVMTNLAVNARDAMPQGGQLTIETENVEIDEDYARQHGVAVPPGSYVLLVVSDSGVGMDEATRARIFEPFFTTKGPGKGTGLGLSTVYGIVKQSHGFIWVYSEVGQGTSFKILLPQVTEAADTDRPEPAVLSSSGTETILLVEDNAGLRKLATRVLGPAGYTVLGAATGEEALCLLERHEAPVHLLLSDVVMPGMSGRHLAEQLAQMRPEMKVLYMSGYTSDTVVRHGVLEAQVPFLDKPFTAAALLRKVREVLDS